MGPSCAFPRALAFLLPPLLQVLATAPPAAPYRAYPLSAPAPSPSPVAAPFPAALRQDSTGALVFDRRAFGKSAGEREVCFREILGGMISLSFDLSTSLSLTDEAGTPFRLSTGRKTTLDAARAAYLEACYAPGQWTSLGSWRFGAGTVGGTSGSVRTNETVDQASGLGTGELAALLRALDVSPPAKTEDEVVA